MGLDMYLYARHEVKGESADAIRCRLASAERWEDGSVYLSRWDHNGPEEREATDVILGLAGLSSLVGTESNSATAWLADPEVVKVDLTTAYWRKANAIHAWFVDNVQDGVDECQQTEVHPELLALLRIKCERALAAYKAGDLVKAEEIMAPRSGFFFGSYELDEWWARDMEYTIQEIHRILNAAAEVGGVTFFYQSSW